MDLELTPIRTRGRAARPLSAEVVRELRIEDLGLLEEEKGSKPQSLVKRLSHRHHTLAKLIASGLGHTEAGMIANYSPSRVSILLGDPSFKELVDFYRGEVDAAFLTVHEKLAGLGDDALEELRARLEEEPESFSNKQLLEIISRMADRTGHGPSSTQVNVNLGLAERLAEARKRVERARIIEHDEGENG